MGLAGGSGQCVCFFWLKSTFLPFAVTVAPSIAQSPKVKRPPHGCNKMVRVGKCTFQGGGIYIIISLACLSCLRGLCLIFILLLWERCTTFRSFLYISDGISYSTWASITSFPFVWKEYIAYPSKQLHFGRNILKIQWWRIRCTGYNDEEEKKGCKRDMKLCRQHINTRSWFSLELGKTFFTKIN